MFESVMNWFVDTLARTETLDLAFEVTELIDLPISADDTAAMGEGDALARDTERKAKPRKRVPLGKQVF